LLLLKNYFKKTKKVVKGPSPDNKKIKNDKGPSPVIFLILLSFSLLLSTGCLFSPLSKGSVEGYIHEEIITGEDRPLEGALISITGSSNTALTDEDGYFRIDEVYIGARNLTITKKEYITKKLVIVIRENETTLIDDGNPIVVCANNDKFLFDGGIIYYDSGEYANALTAFKQLISDYPNSKYADDAQYYIGYINEKKLGYYIQALLEYQELIDNYPNSPYTDDAQLGIGNCYYVTYDFSHAIEAYQKVIDEYPQTSLAPLAQYYIGHSYRRLFNYNRAVLEYAKIINNYPESDYVASAQYYIAYSYYEDYNYNQAILEFQAVIDNYPDSTWPGEPDRLVAPLAQFYIGYCYGKLAQYPEAIAAYQLVIDNYSDSTWSDGRGIPPEAQFRIGDNYRALESWPEARTAYQLVIDNYPNSTWWDGTSIPVSAQYWIDWIDENHPPS